VDAESRLAFADAAVLFERGAGIRSGPERDLMNLEAARCRLRAGQFARSRELSEVMARDAGDARIRVRAATTYEEAAWRSGEPGQRSVVLLTQALSADPGTTDSERVLAVASLARAHAYTGDPVAARRSIDHALTLARPLGDRHVLAEVLERGMQLDLRPRALQNRLALAD
jgi:hypothetical protein